MFLYDLGGGGCCRRRRLRRSVAGRHPSGLVLVCALPGVKAIPLYVCVDSMVVLLFRTTMFLVLHEVSSLHIVPKDPKILVNSP